MAKLKNSSWKNKKILGDLGEAIVHKLVGGNLSDNAYDDEKDLVDNDGRTVEVKTQARHPQNKCFSVAHNQFRKCTEVDRLIFVEFDETDEIKVWEVIDRLKTIRYRTNPSAISAMGLSMIGWKPKNLTLLASHTCPSLAQKMRSHSSDYRFKSSKVLTVESTKIVPRKRQLSEKWTFEMQPPIYDCSPEFREAMEMEIERPFLLTAEETKVLFDYHLSRDNERSKLYQQN